MVVRRTATALLAAAVVVTACGGGHEGRARDRAGGSSTSAAAAGRSPACRLLTTGEVSDLFGSDAHVVPGPAGPTDVANSCLWAARVGAEDLPTLYQLQLSVYETGAIGTDSMGGKGEPLSGIGEEGFLVRHGTLGTTAAYRQGNRWVVLSYGILLSPDAPDPAKQADEVVALLRAVHGRLDA